MSIDASIYQNLKPIEIPSYLESQARAATLSQLASQTEKTDQETKAAQMGQIALKTMPALQRFKSLPEDQKEAAFHPLIEGFKADGVPVHNVPVDMQAGQYKYTPDFIENTMSKLGGTKEWREYEKSKTETEKANLENSRNKERLDPNSEASKKARYSASLIAKQAGLGNVISPDMSAADIDAQAKEGLIGKAISGEYGMRGRELSGARVDARTNVMRENLNLRKDQFASKSADDVTNDKLIRQYDQSIAQTRDAASIINKPVVTNQEFNDFQIELGKAISGAGQLTDSKLERTEYTTMMGKMAEIRQQITGSPQNAVPEEIKQRMLDLASHFNDKMKARAYERATKLRKQLDNVPEAQREQDKAIENYNPDKKSAGSKIKVSDGKQTFEIDPSDLEHAKKDGFQQVK